MNLAVHLELRDDGDDDAVFPGCDGGGVLVGPDRFVEDCFVFH
jgi:hypothetical protein